MIQPINNHIIVEPLEHDSFIASAEGTYDEIGVVTAIPKVIEDGDISFQEYPEIGDKVYFDSWLAAKYPTGEGDKTFWLISYDDVRAIEKQAETTPQG